MKTPDWALAASVVRGLEESAMLESKRAGALRITPDIHFGPP